MNVLLLVLQIEVRRSSRGCRHHSPLNRVGAPSCARKPTVQHGQALRSPRVIAEAPNFVVSQGDSPVRLVGEGKETSSKLDPVACARGSLRSGEQLSKAGEASCC